MNGRELARKAGELLAERGRDSSTEAVFLRVLGLVYLSAFVSFRSQIVGLYGARGIVPVAQFLANVRQQFGYSPR